MFEIAKNIIGYLEYLFLYRKTKWGLAVALLPVLVFCILRVVPLYSTNETLFSAASGGCLLGIVIIVFVWALHSKRVIIGKKTFTTVLSLKAHDPKSNEHIRNAIAILKSELDKLGLLGTFKILEAGQDIITSKEQAHRYRENFDLDLVIWGEVFSGKKDDKELSDFNRLFFTFKIPKNIITSNLTELFKSDINIALVNRDWNIYEFNSLPDTEKISGHLTEVIMFILGVIYCQAKEYVENSIIILEHLFAMLENKSPNEKIEIKDKALKMTPTVLRKSRVLGILITVYKNLGLYFCGQGKYEKAKFYLEKFRKYQKDIAVFGGLAVSSFLLNDYDAAKKYTEEIGGMDKFSQLYTSNKAFFGIWEKNYDSALHFYKEFIKRGRTVDKEIVISMICFLDDRKRENGAELAYDFAIGLLDYTFLQKSEGSKELRNFVKKAKAKPQYKSMVKFVQNEILEKRKKR